MNDIKLFCFYNFFRWGQAITCDGCVVEYLQVMGSISRYPVDIKDDHMLMVFLIVSRLKCPHREIEYIFETALGIVFFFLFVSDL